MSRTVLEIATGRKAASKPGRKPAKVRISPLEKYEQRMLFSWSELNLTRLRELAMMYAIPNAGGYTGGFKKNRGRVTSLKKEGLRSGVPDVCLPVARRGFHSLYIELKRMDGGKTSSDQEWWIRYLRAEGHKVEVCNGSEEAQKVIEAYLG